MKQLFREDLRKGFVIEVPYKGRVIQVYKIWTVCNIVPKGKRKPVEHTHFHCVSYTTTNEKESVENTRGCTYHKDNVVGFDTAHAWYDEKTQNDWEKHLGSAISQAEYFIDEELGEVEK